MSAGRCEGQDRRGIVFRRRGGRRVGASAGELGGGRQCSEARGDTACRNLSTTVFKEVLSFYLTTYHQVNIQNKTHAAYLGNHVPNYVLKSFITHDASDRDRLVRQLKRSELHMKQ